MVIDTETDGPDPARARLTELAVVVVRNGDIIALPAWKAWDGTEPLAALLDVAASDARRGVVVAHNVAFDLAVLRADARASANVLAHPPRWLCTMRLSGIRTSLDALAAAVGVVPTARHTAAGDAATLVAILYRLICAATTSELTSVAGLGVAASKLELGRPVTTSSRVSGWQGVREQLDDVVPMRFVRLEQRMLFADVARRLESAATGPSDPATLAEVAERLAAGGLTTRALDMLLDEAFGET